MVVVRKQKQNYVYAWLHGLSKILGKKTPHEYWGNFWRKSLQTLLSLSEIKERDSDSF